MPSLLQLLLLISLHAGSHVHGLLSTEQLPFVLLHGISDSCQGSETQWVQANLEKASGVKGSCVEIGNGFDSSWYMNMWLQVNEACRKVSAMPELSNGFNLVGLSQGSLIARAVIQTCDTLPQVHNFVSIGGPQAGVASVPLCLAGNFSGMCQAADALLRWAAYTPWLQKALAPAGYFKIPTALNSYYIGCRFLPVINNEVFVNTTYAKRLQSLHQMAFVMFSNDKVIYPRQSSHLRFFIHDSYAYIPPLRRSRIYEKDTLGLREMIDSGRVSFLSLPGGHLNVTLDSAQILAPFLNGSS